MKVYLKNWRQSVYGKIAGVFIGVSIFAMILFAADNWQILFAGGSGIREIRRNEPGAGEKQEKFVVKSGNQKESMQLSISEQKYSEAELEKEFQEAKEILEENVLGENTSLNEVRKDLNLISVIPEKGIKVDWELDNYEVINLQGELQEDALTESGTLLRLDAFLSYEDKKIQHTFYANLYPPKLTAKEKWKKKLETEIQKLDMETQETKTMPLPKEVEGKLLVWEHVVNYRAGAVLILGIALALLVYVSEGQKKKEQEKKRKQQLKLDYAQIISCFTLYLGAGMAVRTAWFKVANEYENGEKQKGKRAAYEEMVYTMHEMQSGASENECYEHFGERCGLAVYRKFGTMLSQNLKKGTRGLAELLKQEAINAFEERKLFAKMQGEEAGTKMLLPMFLMLGVVLVMIVFPAFFTMQI